MTEPKTMRNCYTETVASMSLTSVPISYNPAKDAEKLREAMESAMPFDGWPSRWKRCVAAEVLTQAAQIERLREAFKRYGGHKVTCLFNKSGNDLFIRPTDGAGFVCTCGFEAALKETT